VPSLLERLATIRSPCTIAVLGHLAVALLNFFRIPECEKSLNRRGASNVLLRIGQMDGLDEATAKLCAMALSYVKHRTSV
jgi:hypothetical protein